MTKRFTIEKKHLLMFFAFILFCFAVTYVSTLFNRLKYAHAASDVQVTIQAQDQKIINNLRVYRLSPTNKEEEVYLTEKGELQVYGNYIKKILLVAEAETFSGINGINVAYDGKKKITIAPDVILSSLLKTDTERILNKYNFAGHYDQRYRIFEIDKKYRYKKAFIGRFKGILNWKGELPILIDTFLISLVLTLLFGFLFLPFLTITYGLGYSKNSLTGFAGRFYFLFFIIFLVFYIVQIYISIGFREPLLDDVKYMIRAWWNITGKVPLYGDSGSTGYMPVYYVVLGLWQALFGKGFVSSQMLNILLTAINLALVFVITVRLCRSKIYGIIALFLFFACPSGLIYFCFAAPYALVMFFSLLILLIIVYEEKLPWFINAIVLGVLYTLLILSRRNMVLAVGLFLVVQPFIMRKQRLFTLGLTVVFFVISMVGIVSLFDEGILQDLYNLPVVGNFLFNKLKLVEVPYDAVAKKIEGVRVRTVTVQGSWLENLVTYITNFIKYFVLEFFPLFILSVAALFLLIKKRITRLEVFLVVYFLVMVVIHYHISQSYCVECIIPYTNYFIFFGVIGACKGYRYIVMILRKVKGGGIKNALFLGICSLFAFLFIINFTAKMPNMKRSHISTYKGLANDLKEFVQDDKVLIIGGLYTSLNGVYLADRVFETALINPQFSYKGRLRENELLDKKEKERILKILRESGVWADESMEYWLEEDYNYVLVGIGSFYSQHFVKKKWMDILDTYYRKEKEFVTRHNRKLLLFKRK